MTERPTITLKLNNAPAEKVIEAANTSSPPLASTIPETMDISCLGAGSIPKILQLQGAYNTHGSFKPHLTNKLAIGEPRIREVYWCKFTDAINPEFGKERPVVILSKKSFKGTFSLVVPVTTEDEGQTPDNSHRLSRNPNPNGGYPAWVVASHVYSVSHWRLRRFWDNASRQLTTPRISNEDFDCLLKILHEKIPGLSADKNLKSADQGGISITGIDKTVA
ncbi:UNVERIFIED_ORG: uncharacterized protein YifN (PemK superfamily) [Rhizobium etli]